MQSRKSRRADAGPPPHAGPCIEWAAARLARAPLVYGHGTGDAVDDAAALVFHAASWPHSAAPAAYRWALPRRARAELARLVAERIRTRAPSAYLTGRTWFAGHEIRVDPRVLVPRSPIAELILARFRPFIAGERVRRIVDVGTGSGCIAIACAHAFPAAQVDAADVSVAALEVAVANIRRHGLQRRVHARLVDVYRGLGARRYDIIVANPPYVPTIDVDALPPEYGHEPRLGLDAGADGLDAVRALLAGAAERLEPRGLLVVEVGDTQGLVAERWPELPFLWLDFEHGGGGVFVLTREQLAAHGSGARRRTRR